MANQSECFRLCRFHMNRGFFCCVGLPIVTSDGLAGRLPCLAISPAMNVHRSEVVRLLIGALKRASLNVWRSGSNPRDAGGCTPGGGDIFLGLGDNLKIIVNVRCITITIPISKRWRNLCITTSSSLLSPIIQLIYHFVYWNPQTYTFELNNNVIIAETKISKCVFNKTISI